MKKLLCLMMSLLVVLALHAPALAETNFMFDLSVKTLFVGDTLQLTLERAEGALEEGPITYTSSYGKVASVDENGLVTGLMKGETTITARLTTAKRTWTARITLTVQQPVTEIAVNEDRLEIKQWGDADIAGLLDTDMAWLNAEGVNLEPEDAAALPILLVRAGREMTLNASCQPRNASNRRLTVTSSDKDVLRVSGTTLTGRNAGECLLTLSSNLNPEVQKRYHVLVVKGVTGVKVKNPEKFVFIGGKVQLSAQVSPEDASIKDVTWSSENEKIATVDENGVVTGVSKGTATIRATAADGTKRYGTVSVRVYQQPESITLREGDVTVAVGSYRTLRATVMPNNTNDKTVTWISSDESVAKVNSSGRVTPVAPGTCTITCQSATFPTVFTSATVNVVQLVNKVAFTTSKVDVDVGSTVTVFWETSPANATNAAVELSSNKTSVATVDQDGTVHGLKRGSATITAKTVDGSNRTARITINVLQPVEGVHMKNDTVSVGVDEGLRLTAVLEPEDASNTGMSWYSEDERIATIRGTSNRPTVTGRAWGTTVVHGTTEDGGYTTSATVKVGNYDKALKLTDLYLQSNQIKIVVLNESNMTIERFYFTIECYDIYDQPLACTQTGENIFDGSYRYTLYEGDSTSHGRFYFDNFLQPTEDIGRVVMYITGYRTDDGYSRNIRTEKQTVVEFKSDRFVGQPTATPDPGLAPEG